MASAIQIDTLKFVRRLEAAGMETKHAEAIVEALQEAGTTELATKADVAELKHNLVRFRFSFG